MKTLKVINIKTTTYGRQQIVENNDNLYIYCGRGSEWGNPFVTGIHGSREGVIKKHQKYIEEKGVLKRFIKMIESFTATNIELGCFCKPKSCHCDNYVRGYKKYIEEGKNNERK